MRHHLIGWLVALALVAAACGGGSGGNDSDSSSRAGAATTTTESTTTTERPPELREASTATYVRSDGIRWTATMLAAGVDESPAVRPRECDFVAGRDAVVPIELRISNNDRAQKSARVVLTDGSLTAASYPTGHLQSDLGLRSDQRILLDISDSPNGSDCLDLTYAGYNEYPQFGLDGRDMTMKLQGQLVLVGYRANGVADPAFKEALVFRWVYTGGPPPSYQVLEHDRRFDLDLASVSSRKPVGSQSDSPGFWLLG